MSNQLKLNDMRAQQKDYGVHEKSPYNVMPDLNSEFTFIKEDMKGVGFKPEFPVYLYQGKNLDGANRERAAFELMREGYSDKRYLPYYIDFKGTPEEAKQFSLRTGKRRNLTTEQMSMLYVAKAPDELAKIEERIKTESKEHKKRVKKDDSVTPLSGNKTDKHQNDTEHKVATEITGTVAEIKSSKELKAELPPDKFKQVSEGIINKKISLKTEITKLHKEQKALEQVSTVIDDAPIKKKAGRPRKIVNIIPKDDSYLIPLTDDIFEMIREARAKILDLEMNAPNGMLDVELILKVQTVKYNLGHTLTKENKVT